MYLTASQIIHMKKKQTNSSSMLLILADSYNTHTNTQFATQRKQTDTNVFASHDVCMMVGLCNYR